MRRIQRFYAAINHNRNTIAILGLVHIMGCHKNGYAFVGRIIDQVPKLTAGNRVYPPVGSSRKTIFGSCNTATEKDNFCFQPKGIEATSF
jgi:hypothetical protein